MEWRVVEGTKEKSMDLYAALDQIDEIERIELPPGASSLDLLQAIYRNPGQPLVRRMRAATAALPFEYPKLAVTAIVEPGADFAARLQRARERSALARAPAPIELRPSAPLVSDLRLPPPSGDRRYRR
jgi:hypothetical protein